MNTIIKKYIVDENNKKIAVQLDIKTYEKIEETLENYGLIQLIKENAGDDLLSVNEAREYYKSIKKEI